MIKCTRTQNFSVQYICKFKCLTISMFVEYQGFVMNNGSITMIWHWELGLFMCIVHQNIEMKKRKKSETCKKNKNTKHTTNRFG